MMASSSTGVFGGAGATLLPSISAELRGDFLPLLTCLAHCESAMSATYVMELIFTLVRFDAVLKSTERHLFVSTAQQLITRHLKQLQEVQRKRQLLEENERFVKELVERCAALECLCGAHDTAEGGDTSTVHDGDDMETISGQNSPALHWVSGGLGAAKRTDGTSTTTTARLSTLLKGPGNLAFPPHQDSACATLAGSSSTGGADLRRFSFDDCLDDVPAPTSALPSSRLHVQPQRGHAEGGGSLRVVSSSPSLHKRQLHRPPPLPLYLAGEDGGSPPDTAQPTHPPQEHRQQSISSVNTERDLASKGPITSVLGAVVPAEPTRREHAVYAATPSSGGGGGTPSEVVPTVYSGVQHALQEHFRNNVRRTLAKAAATVPANLSELAQLQQQPRLYRTSPGKQACRDAATAASGSSAPVQHPLSTALLSSLSATNPSTYPSGNMFTSMANAASSASGVDAGGGSLRFTLSGTGGVPVALSPTTLAPVDSAKVWDQVFWRFLDGLTATGDLAVLLALLRGDDAISASNMVAHPTKPRTAMAVSTAGTPARSKALKGIGGGIAGATGSADGVAGAAVRRAPGEGIGNIAKQPALASLSPDGGAQLFMDALLHTGSYWALQSDPSSAALQSSSSSSNSNTSAISTGAAGAVDAAEEFVDRSIMVSDELEVSKNKAELMMMSMASGAADSVTVATAAPAKSTSGSPMPPGPQESHPPALANWEELAKEEEMRLHRDFWAHIPAILVTLTEGMMYGHNSSSSSSSQNGTGSGIRNVRGQPKGYFETQNNSDGTVAGGDEVTRASAEAAAAAAAAAASIDLQATHSSDEASELVSTTHTTNAAAGGEDEGVTVVAAENNGEGENFAPLHVPCSEALQLLSVFSPLLRNYTGAVERLIQVAPQYARAAKAHHGKVLADLTASVSKKLSAQPLSPPLPGTTEAAAGDSVLGAEEEPSAAASVSLRSSSSPLDGARAGLMEATTQKSSVADMQELRDSFLKLDAAALSQRAAAAVVATAVSKSYREKNDSFAASTDVLVGQGLLGSGDRTGIRAVDVVVYALLTAIYVQCTMAVEQRQQFYSARATASGRATAAPLSTSATTPCAPVEEKASPSEVGRPPAGVYSPQGSCQWPPTSSGASFGADPAGGGHEHADTLVNFNNASVSGDYDRVLGTSMANGSLSNTGGGGGGGGDGTDMAWCGNGSLAGAQRDTTGGGVGVTYSLNTSLFQPPSASHGLHLHPLHPRMLALRMNGGGSGGSLANSFFGLLPHSQRSPRLAPHPQLLQPQRQQPLPSHLSFDVDSYSPTKTALSRLREAHGDEAGTDQGEVSGKRVASSSNNEEPAVDPTTTTTTNTAAVASRSAHRPSKLGQSSPFLNLRSLHLATRDIVAAANDSSSVSLPSIMKAELQHLQQQLMRTRAAVGRMASQVCGELALLLFRLLSIVLDWLMPAVHVANPRVWLFYRKWCCDLYRVLCTDAALLMEFRRLLNRSGVVGCAVAPTSRERLGGASGMESHDRSSARTLSATNTPVLRPLSATPPTVREVSGVGTGSGVLPLASFWPRTPIFGAGAATTEDEAGRQRMNIDDSHRESAVGLSKTSVNNARSSPVSPAGVSSVADAFSFVLPGSSLVVSVAQVVLPTQPDISSILAHDDRTRRGGTQADALSLRAAQALLSNEGTVVPLPQPFLITRLVAATLRGIDADIAESLLRVVGQVSSLDVSGGNDGAGADVHDATHHTGSAPVNNRRSGPLRSTGSASAGDPPFPSGAGLEGGTGQGRYEEDAKEVLVGHDAVRHPAAHRPRASSQLPSPHHGHLLQHHHLSTPLSSPIRGARASDDQDKHHEDNVDEDENDSPHDRWPGSGARCSAHMPSVIMHSPNTAQAPVSGGETNAFPNISSMFSRSTPRTSFCELGATAGAAHLSFPSQPLLPEAPTLVHHHRFRYPNVCGYADVAHLYASALEDAEVLLSPHDPIYASLVLSAANLQVHDLHDSAAASSLIESYLVSVAEEPIQGPVWEVLPVISFLGGTSAMRAPGGEVVDRELAASSAHQTANRGFSVTRVRQGNTQGPTSTMPATGSGYVTTAASPSLSPPLPQQQPQQQPFVPTVIPSWNNEAEKEEFISTLSRIQQLQVLLHPASQ